MIELSLILLKFAFFPFKMFVLWKISCFLYSYTKFVMFSLAMEYNGISQLYKKITFS
jgi:hypothetical protein